MTFEDKDIKKSHEVQRQKYGKGYGDEMRRRRLARTNYSTPAGFKWLKENDPERFAQIIADREAKRKNAAKQKAVEGKDFAEIEDRTQEV